MSNLKSNAVKWIVAIVGIIALVVVFAIWRTIDQKTGGGFLSGALRGALVFGGIVFLLTWAKKDGGKKSGTDSEQLLAAQMPVQSQATSPSLVAAAREFQNNNATATEHAKPASTNWIKSNSWLATGVATVIALVTLGYANTLASTLRDREQQISAMSERATELETRITNANALAERLNKQIADLNTRPASMPKNVYVKDPDSAAKPATAAKRAPAAKPDAVADARNELRKAEAICAEIHCNYNDKDQRAWNRVIAAKVALKNALLASD